MSILPIYLYGRDELRQKAALVKDLDNEIIRLIYDLFETMHHSNGIGLAATQVGELKRVIVIDVTPAKENEEENEGSQKAADQNQPKKLVLVNPRVVEQTGSWTLEEGCLSIPDVRGDVDRAERIKVRFRDGSFKETELEAGGLLARVILHEIDHLDGVLFIDHLSTAKRGLLGPKLRKIKKGETEVSYPAVTARANRRRGRVEA